MSIAKQIFGVVAAIAMLGCGRSEEADSIAVVTVTAARGMPTVTQLRVVVSNAGLSDTKMFPQVPAAGGIQFDTSFAITFPTSRTGSLVVDIFAVGLVGQVVATGDNTIPIVAGGRTDVVVHLGLVSTVDAGRPDSDDGGSDTSVARLPGSDGPTGLDVVQPGSDMLGTGGRLGSGGVVGPSSTGGTPYFGSGGGSGSGGKVTIGTGGSGLGGTTRLAGQGGSGGTSTPSSGALTSYTFPASIEPCTPTKDVSGGQSGNFGTKAAYCFRTADDFDDYGCSGADDRTLKINGTAITKCGGKAPAKLGSFYYFEFGAGTHEYASVNWYCSVSPCMGPHPVPSCGKYPAWQSGATVAPCAGGPTSPVIDAGISTASIDGGN